jgi:hypothetical protein
MDEQKYTGIWGGTATSFTVRQQILVSRSSANVSLVLFFINFYEIKKIKNFLFYIQIELPSVADEPRKSLIIETGGKVNTESLGDSPRSVYPLVVILKLNTDLVDCEPNDTVSGKFETVISTEF